MIELQGIAKRYGKVQALDGLTMKASEHQVIGLLGRNGAGKTTALNILTGYFPPDEGCVLINGMNMLTEARNCKRQIGYLPEKPPLYDEMTVWDYLTFVASLREVERGDIPAHLKETLTLCGLEAERGRIIGHLSKGYRQRVGIAQALCGNPDIIILDEPTVGLDPGQVTEIRKLIRELGRTHTVIFSSHILSEVQQVCDRVIILHHGKMIRDLYVHEERMEKTVLNVAVCIPEKKFLEALRGMEGLQKVELLPSSEPYVTEARLTGIPLRAQKDFRARFFYLMAAMDAPIYRMTPEQTSLEEVFLRVTEEDEQR